MSKESSVTPKGTVTLRDVGDGMAAVGYNGTATFKAKRGSVNASLAISDQTVKNVKVRAVTNITFVCVTTIDNR